MTQTRPVANFNKVLCYWKILPTSILIPFCSALSLSSVSLRCLSSLLFTSSSSCAADSACAIPACLESNSRRASANSLYCFSFRASLARAYCNCEHRLIYNFESWIRPKHIEPKTTSMKTQYYSLDNDILTIYGSFYWTRMHKVTKHLNYLNIITH